MSEVNLEFLARQQAQIIEEIAQVRDAITVLTGMAQRAEGTMLGLTTEIVGLRSMLLRHERRLQEISA